MKLLSDDVDQDVIEIQLFAGPADGAWIETTVPQGPFYITFEGRWKYVWDGEGIPNLKYEQDLEIENDWLLAHGLQEEEE